MIKNSLGPDQQDYDNYNGRLQLLWDAGEDVEVLLSGYYGRYKNNGLSYTTTRAIIDSEALTGPITGGVNDGLVKVATGAAVRRLLQCILVGGRPLPPGHARQLQLPVQRDLESEFRQPAPSGRDSKFRPVAGTAG